MSRVIVDSSTLAKLQTLPGPVDLCDEQGHLVGQFVPYPGGLTAASLELDISVAELESRAANFSGRPLADLVAEWERRK